MFNWFKSKIELKNSASIMCSSHNKKGLKLGSEIIVPSNFECLIFHKGKCFNTLSEGKYKMDKKTFAELIEYQQRRKFKVKYIKCICHYVNISTQKLEIKFKKQKFIVDFVIAEPIKFANLALLYTCKVDDDYTLNILNDVFYELLTHVKGDYKQINQSSLNDYGINIASFAPQGTKASIFNTSSTQNDKNADNISASNAQTETAETSLEQQNSDINKTSLHESDLDTTAKEKTSPEASSTPKPQQTFPACPKCNNVAKFNTTYCLRCGHKLQ